MQTRTTELQAHTYRQLKTAHLNRPTLKLLSTSAETITTVSVRYDFFCLYNCIFYVLRFQSHFPFFISVFTFEIRSKLRPYTVETAVLRNNSILCADENPLSLIAPRITVVLEASFAPPNWLPLCLASLDSTQRCREIEDKAQVSAKLEMHLLDCQAAALTILRRRS
jgi:hypothetical protein